MRRSAAPSQVLGNAGKKPRFTPPGKCTALCPKNETKEMDQEIKLKEIDEKEGGASLLSKINVQNQNDNYIQSVESTERVKAKPCFSIDKCSKAEKKILNVPKADSLVMPRPNASHQWMFNKAGFPVVDVVVDPYIANNLRPHQKEGIIFLYECVMGMRVSGRFGAILADEMGLGKTLQCIALVWTLLRQGPYGCKPVLKRALVVTPGSLVKNWKKEFQKWLGSERIKVFTVDQ
ncbi:hypothetical protein HGM15179_014283, partial [Zosterops borbonicus]